MWPQCLAKWSHRPCGRGFEVMSGGTLLQASVGHGRARWVSFWGVGVAELSLRSPLAILGPPSDQHKHMPSSLQWSPGRYSTWNNQNQTHVTSDLGESAWPWNMSSLQEMTNTVHPPDGATALLFEIIPVLHKFQFAYVPHLGNDKPWHGMKRAWILWGD